ncbi:hypothetical protein [Chitinophaga vietnamensis]|uniref:hypothetical protein n=1 Tax=Chitinophaga vietnamensis TaxID=2593957 RepID=UPI001177C569|nr:hypothetical protein [Chitinophaga vietnamensis]
MKTKNDTGISSVFYRVTQGEARLETLINQVNSTALPAAEKYAYQAFCCAMLAKSTSGMLQKGKYIQQYGVFIEKAMAIKNTCYEARLFRFLVEQKLEHVKFTSHIEQDRSFLQDQVNHVQDDYLKELTFKALENE